MWTGRVAIGTMHTMGPIDVSLPIALFHERHPGVELSVWEQSSEELAELLRTDELDLAFLSVTERIESHGLALRAADVCEELVLILPRHALAGRRELGMDDLQDEEFVSYREGSRLREAVDLRRAGGRLHSQDHARVEREPARPPAGRPRAWAWRSCPDRTASDRAPRWPWRRLAGPLLTRDITLAWRADRRLAPASAEFLNLARETFADGAAT